MRFTLSSRGIERRSGTIICSSMLQVSVKGGCGSETNDGWTQPEQYWGTGTTRVVHPETN